MVIGVDLDNTIVCYDALFHRVARERGWIPARFPRDKTAIRDHLRRTQGEAAWTGLQGVVYGARIGGATAFPGVKEFFRKAARAGHTLHIVSHKTRHALAGPRHDLHRAALGWLEGQGFFDANGIGLARNHVHFGTTRAAKLRCIRRLACEVFIDDLREVFEEPRFPGGVQRVLFAPAPGSRPLEGASVLGSWNDIARTLLHRPSPADDPAALRRIAARLAGRVIHRLEPVGGGRNSRVYKAVPRRGSAVAIKAYLRQPGDNRDRLGTEFGALALLARAGFPDTPRPIACDRRTGIAAYEFVAGDSPGSPSVADVDAAVDFLGRLRNLARRRPASWTRPASEARFSVAGMLQVLRERRARLEAAEGCPAVLTRLRRFLTGELDPAIDRLTRWSLRRLQRAGVGADRILPEGERTLSPSDFGFHNAVRRAGGGIVWLDFEYFGWDDPAKMIVDFLLHPAMRLSPGLRRRFAGGILRRFPDQPGLVARVEAVFPLFGLKWCLILLNEFLPADLRRRRFARGATDRDAAQRRQLAQARRLLRRILREHDRNPFLA